ncbi:zinc ribbon domain-containing protein [Pseudoalteromonas marina]|uniref:zinc ribbon domain-containing protein n=1 Tax=Pseudoalteromonas marina TaxID=267375 RepID=UPI0023F0539A|nr:zinc ribbon domain-containing protein [Pseudoalteromonas marina]
MYCKECRGENELGSKYCSYCGKELNKDFKSKYLKSIFISLITLFILIAGFLSFIGEKSKKESVNSNKEKKITKIYDVAIDTHRWCWKFGNGGGRYGPFINIVQLVGDNAIFMGKGYRLIINKKQLNGEIYRGKDLEDSAKYIGKVKDVSLESLDGFSQNFEYYEVITEKDFYAAKLSLGANGCN